MSCALLHPDVGLHLTAMLSPALSASDIVTAAAADVIRLHALEQFALYKQAPNGLVLGYGMIRSDQIVAAVQRLATIINRCAPQSIHG